MKCPICFSLMENWDGRHAHGPDHIRMNLNCRNMKCLARTQANFGTHMGVLLHYDDPWKCYEYHLPFPIGKWWFVLIGQSNLGVGGETTIQSRNVSIQDWFKISRYLASPSKFIPISTGDDMHEHAQFIFDEKSKELKRLSHFS